MCYNSFMKKTVFIMFNLLFLSSFAFEDVPILPQDSGIDVRYVENQNYLINYDKMKKSDKIKDAQEELSKSEKPKIQFDSRQIIHQRALDFTTRQNNSMPLPRF